MISCGYNNNNDDDNDRDDYVLMYRMQFETCTVHAFLINLNDPKGYMRLVPLDENIQIRRKGACGRIH